MPITHPLPRLNFHHLRAFWLVAREGGVGKAAEVLRVAPSAVSMQVASLQDSAGQRLFERRGRGLVLTAAGRTALEFAERIFTAGLDLEDWLGRGRDSARRPLRVGALSTLSKNLQFDFVWPLLRDSPDSVAVQAGPQDELLSLLAQHKLDVVLSSLPAGAAEAVSLEQVLLGEMAVYLVGRPPFRMPKQPFPRWLEGLPLFLPSRQSTVRLEFDTLVARARVHPQVRAEIDDMALLRLLALSGAGLALVPRIVVERELATGSDLRIERVPGLKERFFAITRATQRRDERIETLVSALQDQLASAESQTYRRIQNRTFVKGSARRAKPKSGKSRQQ
jgi:LysR family transcriptional activator of nhaA